jgi:anti-sigma-K factor RskA
MTDEAPDIHALSGAYALDALEPQDRADFERHLESCAACDEELRSFREAVAVLADGAAEAPPDRLRASVLAGISEVRPLPPVIDEATVHDLAPRRSSRRSTWLMVAAVVLGVVAIGGVWRTVTLQEQVAQLSNAAADLSSLLTAADATTITGVATSGGQAAVVMSPTRGEAALVTQGLAPAPAGHVYQVWFIPSTGAPVSAGFLGDSASSATLLNGNPATAAAIGVTLEPAGGSTAPTTTPVIAIPLPTRA